MKKLTALILALMMLATVFTGCTQSDLDLMNALEVSSKAENAERVLTLKGTLAIEEPITKKITEGAAAYWDESDEEWLAKSENNELKTLASYINELTFTAETKADGGKSAYKLVAALPDFEVEAKGWSESDGKDAKLIVKTPFLADLMSNGVLKGYVVLNTADDIWGESDIPKDALSLSDVDIKQFMQFVDSSFVKSVNNENDLKVYDISVNDASLDALTGEIIEKLDNPLVVNLVAAVISEQMKKQGQEASVSELRAAIADILPYVKEARSYSFAELRESGLINEGLTAKYYVNKDGLIEKVQDKLKVTIDMNTELGREIYEEFFDSNYNFKTCGKISFTLDFEESAKYGSAKVQLPVINEENSVDLGKEYVEYKAIIDAYEAESSLWSTDHPADVYVTERDPYTPMTFKNLENGKEITLTPGLVSNEIGICMPLTELVSIIDDVEVRWNEKTMGVELVEKWTWGEYINYIPNKDGQALLGKYVREELNGDYYDSETGEYVEAVKIILSPDVIEVFAGYTPIALYYAYGAEVNGYNLAYFDENGKAYVDFDLLFDRLGYKCKVEGNTVSFIKIGSLYDQLHENLSGNVFYELAGSFLDTDSLFSALNDMNIF